MQRLYPLTDNDRQIFAISDENPNIFTDWYLRGPNTGTWYSPEDTDSRKIKRYEELFSLWNDLGKPKGRFEHEDQTYRVIFKMLDRRPYFHHWHGFRFDPWQLDLFMAKQDTHFLAGGFGAGKTIAVEVGMGIRAAKLPGYRGFCLAPYSEQAKEVYKKFNQIIAGTLYEKRFLIKKHLKPYPELMIGNDYVGENGISFYAIMDDSEKVLNLEGDEAMVDQSEQLNNLPDHRRAISSRLRGYYQGRERLGITTWIGNPYDNPEFWDLFDVAEAEPEHYYSYTASTYDNEHLSEQQVGRFERDVGEDEQSKNVFLKGQRPIGAGKQFQGAAVENCRKVWLDDMMKRGLEEHQPGFVKLDSPKIGIHKWELPPVENATYLVIADAGTKNPPHRDSGVVGVWDISNFPTKPATLQAFTWVFGNGSPEGWMKQFHDYVLTYRAVTRCAFDATNWGSGYDSWLQIFSGLMAEPLRLGGETKFKYINGTKVMLMQAKLEYPSIPAITNQLAGYDLPDDKMRQDVAMMVIMTCGWLERMFYMRHTKDAITRPIRNSRNPVHGNRYVEHIR